MKITILTLFPGMFKNFLEESIIKKSILSKKVEIEIVDFRDFSKDKHKKVDDYQYGGGAGMVLALQPIVNAIKETKKQDSHVVLLSPQGKTLDQPKVKTLSKFEDLILIAGHYEGFDQRITNYINESVSIGDYILTGGELPAMVLTDSIVRLVDGVISKESLETETFENNLLDYDLYTKPQDYDGHKVPEILFSGNHQEIKKFRLQTQINKTKINRHDLYNKYVKEQKG